MIKKNIDEYFANSKGKRICIIGDIMLDKYYIGDVTRISPEAPVQVFEIRNTEPKLGGAANVSFNIKSLECEPFLIGLIGKDADGKEIKKQLRKQKQSVNGLIEVSGRPTTCKTRVIASSHHLLRIDSESKDEIDLKTEQRILSMLNKYAKSFSIIVLQDYNKGLLTKSLIKKITDFGAKKKIKILVDPKFENFKEYKNVYVFKPNRKELEDAMGRKAKTDSELDRNGKELLSEIKCANLVLTLGEHGMKVFSKGKDKKVIIHPIKTQARKVSDVSGAGDTVISTIAVMLAGGAGIFDAVEIANVAAGIVVEEVGIVPITKKNLLNRLKQ